MIFPEGLTPEEQLYLVVGKVAARSAMIEDATQSLARALDGDFKLALGQQRGLAISRTIDQCKMRFRSDARLRALEEDAVSLLTEVQSSIKKRNDLVHKLWVVENRENEPKFRLLTEDDSFCPKTTIRNPQESKTANELGVLVQSLDKQQRQMNAIKHSVADQFRSCVFDASVLDQLDVRLNRALVRGAFDVVDGKIVFRDRALAEELNA